MQRNALLAVCFVFHVSYFFSIFDIYFRSPIDPGVAVVPVDAGSAAPAARLVLFVADGLRADTCFRFLGRDLRFHDPESSLSHDGKDGLDAREASYQADAIIWPKDRTSFLREIVETKGSWGLSHTRVPTESRPGHVAVIAGFYEDVSAVTRGWQDNPVEFDHVFNQSKKTWLWGSPDITRMFAKRHEHVVDWFYSTEEEDFAAKDLTMLDTWVFNKVKEMLNEAEKNKTLAMEMAQEKVIFFLHLLGLDSNGHAYRPHSPEYLQNIASVDRGVRAIYEMFEDYFRDNRTAYVFTSDHGMGNQGAHGDGDPTNTRTPLIAWGAGVRGPERSTPSVDPRNGINTGFSKEEENNFSYRWGLSHLLRKDVEQADVAPLLSSLIGLPVPVNSVGRLPQNFMDHSRYTSESLMRNAKQLLVQAKFKESNREIRQLFLRKFKALERAGALLVEAEDLLEDSRFQEAEVACKDSMSISIDALRYYQTYDRQYLITVVVLGYLGWILLLSMELAIPNGKAEFNVAAKLVLAGFILASVLQVLEQSPFMYHVYLAFPAWFWTHVVRHGDVWRNWLRWMSYRPSQAIFLSAVVAGTQIIVFGYTYRWVYVVLFFSLGLWPMIVPELWEPPVIKYNSHTGQIKQRNGMLLRLSWALSCSLLGAFTFIPLDVNDSPALLICGGVVLVVLFTTLFRSDLDGFSFQRFFQISLIALSTLVTWNTDASLKAKNGLPLLNQTFTWIAFFVSPILICFSSTTPYKRFLSIFAGLATSYSLLSVNYEVLFYAMLGFTLMQWLVMERAILFARQARGASKPTSERISLDDVRSAFMFLCFVHIAFFGTGNIASMSSFQISSSFRFTTVFSPFLMGGLLIVKLLIPYTLVTSVVTMISAERLAGGASAVSPHRLFFLVLALSDLLAVHLFFWVRDQGSWLEIGNSISQFGFVNCQLIFIPLLFALASVFLRGVSMDLPQSDDKRN